MPLTPLQHNCNAGYRHKISEIIASITKIITSHFAIVIEKPAIPRAPNIYAINAKIKNTTANPIRSAIFYSPNLHLTDKLIIRLKVFII